MSFRIRYRKSAENNIEQSTRHFMTSDSVQVYVQLDPSTNSFSVLRSYVTGDESPVVMSGTNYKDIQAVKIGVKKALEILGIRFEREHYMTEKLKDALALVNERTSRE